jgi:hypothetical protein
MRCCFTGHDSEKLSQNGHCCPGARTSRPIHSFGVAVV